MNFEPHQFLTSSLRNHEWGINVAKILAASINSVNPGTATRKFVAHKAGICTVASKIYNLDDYTNIYVIGAGKAGAPMSRALSDILGNYLTEGIVIVKEGHLGEKNSDNDRKIKLLEASHPLPDERSVNGTKKIINLIRSAGKNDLVFCLISGGGSSLLTAPVDDILLSDLQIMIKLLLASGANINEINSLRKHLDAVKGGRLTKIASPARMISLILSDVLGDPLDIIASGPTVPDTSTFYEAYSILEKYNLKEQIPTRIINYLEQGVNDELNETPKPGDPIFDKNQNIIIGNNNTAAMSALEEAKSLGFNTMLLTTYLQGEARHTGKFLASIAFQLRSSFPPIKLPACIVIGGETTVTVLGDGIGGRNQEVALGAVSDLSDLPNTALVTLATDGEDGPTDAAGAVVTGETSSRALKMKMDSFDYLNRNDSYHYFSVLDDLIKLGPTNTNVNDLSFIFSF